MSVASFRIPDDLVTLIAEGRLIPFIGAGFSTAHGLPGWDELLHHVAKEVKQNADSQPVPKYAEIVDSCERDNLRVAEYLYLVTGGSIGPIRHAMSDVLRSDAPLPRSTPHVELANLGAAQVYTTNFDDLIERTYRELDLPVDVVSLPRDVAQSHANRTQVVKYHGDLRHDETLVITESQYYTRLEFESPMDLKFRSDLLGKAVLFIGYSFSDVNIRVIWFKLMQMMRDVPEKDRLPSYIVRLRKDDVLDTLYEAVGLRTIVIDPDGTAETEADKSAVLAEFMRELATKSSAVRISNGDTHCEQFVSLGLIESARGAIQATADRRGPRSRYYSVQSPASITALISVMTSRTIPPDLANDIRPLLDDLWALRGRLFTTASVEVAVWFSNEIEYSIRSSAIILFNLIHPWARDALFASAVDWPSVWDVELDDEIADELLTRFTQEANGHLQEDEPLRDHDVAYALDLIVRLRRGELGVRSPEFEKAADDAVAKLAELYPAASDHTPVLDLPNVERIAQEIDSRADAEAEELDDDEIAQSAPA